MARVLIRMEAWGSVTDRGGHALANLSYVLKNTDGTAATHYSAETGGTSSTADLTTDVNGGASLSGADRWIEAGEYDVTTNGKTFRVHTGGTPSSVASGDSPTAIYMTALDASFQAFLDRIPDGGTGVVPQNAGTLSLSSALTISQSCTLRFEAGSQLKKTDTFAGSEALLISGAVDVQIEAPEGAVVIDGNRTGGATGIGMLVQSGASLVMRGGVIQNHASVGIKAAGSGTDVRCYGVECSSNQSGSNTADGFKADTGAKLRTWDCVANDNDRYGFNFDVAAAPGCRLDGYANGNQQGATIRSFRGTCGTFVCEDNSNGGLAVEFGGGSWSFGQVRPLNNGLTAANASAYGVELFGASNCQFGEIIERGCSGYGLAITKNPSPITTTISNSGSSITSSQATIPSTGLSVWPKGGVITIGSETILYTGVSSNTFTGCVRGAFGTTAATHADGATIIQSNVAQNNSFGVVECNNLDAWDSDPGVHISGGSSRNHIDVLDVHGRTFALSFGEGSGAANDNTVGLLHCDTISFAIWRITNGSNNRVERIAARDCWNSNTDIADALLYFSAVDSGATTTGNACGSLKHRTVARPSPNATISQHSSASGNYLEGAKSVDLWAPGGILQTISRDRVLGNMGAALTSGTLHVFGGIVIPAGKTVSSATLVSGTTALATGTHQWFCIIDQSTLAILAVTADDTSTAWAADTAKTLAFAASYTPAQDEAVYLGVMVAATTPPTLLGTDMNSQVAAIANANPKLAATSSTSQTTPLTVGTIVSGLTSNRVFGYGYLS